MAAWQMILIVAVVVAFPVAWVAMWWSIAKQLEIAQSELRNHPSLKKYDRQILLAAALWLLGSLPDKAVRVVAGRSASPAILWLCLALSLIGSAVLVSAWRGKCRAIRGLAEQTGA